MINLIVDGVIDVASAVRVILIDTATLLLKLMGFYFKNSKFAVLSTHGIDGVMFYSLRLSTNKN
jgi:hypothetical protein